MAKIPVDRIQVVEAGSDPASYYRGHGKHIKVKLSGSNATLASLPQRYSHYFATISVGRTAMNRDFRILGHDGSTLYLSDDTGSVSDMASSASTAITIDVTSKLFSVFTDGVEGFPDSFIGRTPTTGRSALVPRTNIRIGFAFHQNPKDVNASRFPPLNAGKPTFFADWGNATALEALRKDGYRYVMYDILFNTKFEEDPLFPNSNSLGPDTPRPELRRLVLPYRY